MSEIEKLLIKLKERNRNFTYKEFRTLFLHFGYAEINKGKSSGSRVAFINNQNHHIIRLHRPHQGDKLKSYQIDLIVKELLEQGVIK